MFQQHHRTGSWSQLVVGIAMLGCVILAVLIKLSNTIGISKALGSVVLGILIAAWIIVGVVLIVHGLSKM